MRLTPQTPLTPFIGDRTPRVLVVEDDPASARLLETYLRKWLCTVSLATNGAQARAMARKFSYDLVLLDVMMPDQSGFAVCEALQADPATAHIPVIFITALTSADAKVMGFETGGHDFMTKPFDPGELAARTGARLRQKYAEDALRQRHTRLAAIVKETDPGQEE